MTAPTTATVNLTAREFLATQTGSNGQPLAKSGPGVRGRFSNEAVEALRVARESGVVFLDDVKVVKVKAAKAVSTTTAAPAATKVPTEALPTVNPKEVRAWAKQNGHEVGERGRIHGSVVKAFLAAGGQAVVPTAKRITPLDMPKRVRQQKVAFVVEPARYKGSADTRIARTICGSEGPNGTGCRKAVSVCACPTGPVAPHWTSVSGQPMDLTVTV